MLNDAELLRAYADEKSESAFGELVRRHVNLVYSIALRQCGGDAHLAEDVAQKVFTDLARKAGQLSGYAVLGGWLYRSAQFAASDVVRAERRRRAREQEASAMQNLLSSNPAAGDADWQKLAPVLDQAIGELAAPDRDAVVLRFFEGRPFAEIGATLRLTEDAARMRVERALDKLRAALGRRGITSTSAALATALANQAAVQIPAGLAATLTSVALTGAGASVGPIGFLFGLSKLKTAAAFAVVLGATALFLWQRATNEELKRDVETVRRQRQEVVRLREVNLQLSRLATEVAALRQDDAELARLRDQAAALKERLAKAPPPDAKPREFSIAGQIRYPGRVRMADGSVVTLGDVIAKAGGGTASANLAKIRVIRTLAGGETKVFANLDSAGSGKGFVLEPGDVIYVPEDILSARP